MTIEEERKHHEITPANGDKSILRRAKELTVVVKEANFPLVPEISWILCHSALTEGHIHLCEETFVPFAVNVPVLHCMGDVRSLDDVWGGRKTTGRMISTEEKSRQRLVVSKDSRSITMVARRSLFSSWVMLSSEKALPQRFFLRSFSSRSKISFGCQDEKES